MTSPAPVAPTPASSWNKSCHLLNPPASSLEWFSNSQFYRPSLRSIIRRASIQRILRQSAPRSQNGASPETSEGNEVVDRLAASRLRGARGRNASFRGTLAKTEGLFSNRVAYRRGGHIDHLRHGRSQLPSFPPPCQ